MVKEIFEPKEEIFETKGEVKESLNIIQEFLNDLFGDSKQFIPKKHFYNKTDINSRRWGMIYRGEKSPTLEELNNITSYFNEKISFITNKRQLKLF